MFLPALVATNNSHWPEDKAWAARICSYGSGFNVCGLLAE